MTAMSPTYDRYSTDTITDSRVGRLLTGTSVDTVGRYSADTVYRPTVGRGWLK